VLDLAIDAGYGSHEAFTRAFTRAYGKPPRVFTCGGMVTRCSSWARPDSVRDGDGGARFDGQVDHLVAEADPE
jgi:AraC-like DNA-binding protein